MSAPHLVIAAGGTGGHMFPAQALAQEMLRRGWRVTLSTDARGARYAGGFPAEVARRTASAATFARGGIAAKLAAPVAIAAGVAQTLAWFLRDRPAAVAGFGGYPSLPALAAAVALNVPRLIHEQNGVLGRVNRAFARRVGAVACGTWPVANAPEGAALVPVGNPIRDAARAAAETPYAPPGEGPLRLLAFGGSQGASVFSRLVPEAVALLPEGLRARLRVTQQAREGEMQGVLGAYARMGVDAEVAPFFADLPDRLAAAQAVVCRAGASTVAELTAIGRPSVLIPFPAAMDDHQTANARPLAEAGAAALAPEAGLTPESLSGHIRAILEQPEAAARMAAAARALGRPDAARVLADLVDRIAARRPPLETAP